MRNDARDNAVSYWRGGAVRIEELKNFNVDRADLDTMILIERDLQALVSGYANRRMTAPAWVSDQVTTVSTEIARRSRDELELRLKRLDAEAAGLETASEKRERLKTEREAIMAQLNPVVSA